KPVVAGNVGGALDAVLDGETGLLVDPLDALAVADAITTLLRDEALAKRRRALAAGPARRARERGWRAAAAGDAARRARATRGGARDRDDADPRNGRKPEAAPVAHAARAVGD